MTTADTFLASLPERLWFQTEKGWASRVPTKEDLKARKKAAIDFEAATAPPPRPREPRP
jgi:hypothetical protein